MHTMKMRFGIPIMTVLDVQVNVGTADLLRIPSFSVHEHGKAPLSWGFPLVSVKERDNHLLSHVFPVVCISYLSFTAFPSCLLLSYRHNASHSHYPTGGPFVNSINFIYLFYD